MLYTLAWKSGSRVSLAKVAEAVEGSVAWRCPRPATVFGASNHHKPLLPTGSYQIQTPLMHKQGRPKLPLYLGTLLPRCAPVGRTENERVVFAGAGSKQVMRGDVLPIWQHGNARRANVPPCACRRMIDHDARHPKTRWLTLLQHHHLMTAYLRHYQANVCAIDLEGYLLTLGSQINTFRRARAQP